MYIPIIQTLQCLLTNEAVLLEVGDHHISCWYLLSCVYIQIKHGHKSSSDLLHDFCDGEAFTTHPLFSVKLDALQTFFYFNKLKV